MSASDDYSSYIYLLEGESVDLSLPSGVTEIYSNNPAAVMIDGSRATAIGPGPATIYYYDGETRQKLCDIIAAGEYLEVLLLESSVRGAGSSDKSEIMNKLANPLGMNFTLTTGGFLDTPLSYDIVLSTHSDQFYEMGIFYENIQENGIPCFHFSPYSDNIYSNNIINDVYSEAYLPDIVGLGFDAVFNSDVISEKTLKTIAENLIQPETYPAYVDQLSQNLTNVSDAYPKAALEKLIAKADDIGLSSDISDAARAVLDDPESTGADYTKAVHTLRREIYQKSAADGIQHISLEMNSDRQKPGAVFKIYADAYTDTGTSRIDIPMSWESDNPAVATVDQNGVVTTISEGTANITATAGSVSETAPITVGKYFIIYTKDRGVESSLPNFVLDNHPDFGSYVNYAGFTITKYFIIDYDLIDTYFVKGFGVYNTNRPSDEYLKEALNRGLIRFADQFISLDNEKYVLGIYPSLFSHIYCDFYQNDEYNGFYDESMEYINDSSSVHIRNTVMDESIGLYPSPYLKVSDVSDKTPFESFWLDFLTDKDDLYGQRTYNESSFFYNDLLPSGELEKEALRQTLKMVADKKSSDYTDDSWAAFESRRDDAQALINGIDDGSVSFDSKEVTDALYDLKNASRNLEYLDDGVIEFSMVEEAAKMPVNDTRKLYIRFGDEMNDRNLTWTSSDPAVADVDSKGVIYTRAAGNTTITAVSQSDPSVRAECAVEVYVPIKHVDFGSATAQISFDGSGTQTIAFIPAVFPYNAVDYDITWKSSDTSVASIDSNGVAVIKSGGSTYIDVTLTDHTHDDLYENNVYNYTCELIVERPRNETVNLLFVSQNDQSALANASKEIRFGQYISCERIPAYGDDLASASPALLALSERGFDDYDILVFDMGGHEQIGDALKEAVASGKAVVVLDGSNTDYSSNALADAETLDNLALYMNKAARTQGGESRIWAEKFLMRLSETFCPGKVSAVPGWVYDCDTSPHRKALYIGPDAGEWERCVNDFSTRAYGSYYDWTYLTLRSDISEYSPADEEHRAEFMADLANYNTEDDAVYQADLAAINIWLETNSLGDYDLILCDSLYLKTNGMNVQASGGWGDVIGYNGMMMYWSMNWKNKYPDTKIIASRTIAPPGSILFGSDPYYSYTNFTSADTLGLDKDSSAKTYGLYHYITKTFGNEITAGWPGLPYLSNSGFIYHPVENLRFPDVYSYMDWYEKSDHYTPGALYVGIFAFSVYPDELKALTEAVESRGYNVVVGDGTDTGVYDDLDGYFINPDTGECYVSCFISIKNWALYYSNQQQGVAWLEKLNVPVIKIVGNNNWGSPNMYDKNSGITEGAFSWMASSSNVDGMIDFISTLSNDNEQMASWAASRAIAWAELNATANEDKDVAILYYNYPPGKEDIGANYLNVMRSFAGDGAAKNAKDPSAPVTAPVDCPGLIRVLDEEGYRADPSKLPVVTIGNGSVHTFDYGGDPDQILNEKNLINLIYAQGINVGSYAPGVLDTMVMEYIAYHENIPEGHATDGSDWWGCELIPASDYVDWLDDEVNVNQTMAAALRNELEETWGTTDQLLSEAPSEDNNFLGGMIWHDSENRLGRGSVNYIVIPMIKIGDVRLMPEPNRALASDTALDSAAYHGDIAPTHQYVAFYFWLNRGTGVTTSSGAVTGVYDFGTKTTADPGVDGDSWKACALVHFGTHGTQEWLPGRSVGLSRTDDWGPVLLPVLPNIYPYIVANVGEGLTAEYRGNALIISHMTPPMIKTQLYDDLLETEAAVSGYQKQKSTGTADPALLRAYRTIITDGVYEIGWDGAFDDYFRSLLTEDKAGIPASADDSERLVKAYLVDNEDAFDVFLEDHLHSYIESIKESSLSYGMHTYGRFDESQAAPMIWNMWSRQGLDDVLLDTYFTDVRDAGGRSIPTSNEYSFEDGKIVQGGAPSFEYDESNVLMFVEKVVSIRGHTPTADEIREALDEAFPKDAGDRSKQDPVVGFLLGPAGYFTDSAYPDAASVVAAWKTESIDGHDTVYDAFSAELFEFYWYNGIPKNLADDAENKSARFRATDGTTLNDTKLESVMTFFVGRVLSNGSYSTDPASTVEWALSSSGLGNANTSRPWYNDEMVAYVLGNERILYPEKLRSCGDAETQALLNALSAGYISPSGGNDPVQRPSVLPTGRNFYGIDPSMYPTPAARKVGQAMADQLLIQYYETHGEWPDTVSFMRFGVDYIRDEGTLEACLFRLLGCELKWNAGGVFQGAVPVTLDDGQEKYDEMFQITLSDGTVVYRPRVDVVYNSAGMRDGYGSMLRHIDKAVKEVSLLDGSDDMPGVSNNVRKNADDLYNLFIEAGLDEEAARELSTSRVFAQELGTYEIGTGNLVSASGNMGDAGDNQDDVRAIADLYLEKMSYVYTENNWGETSDTIRQALQALLGRTDASMFASSSNLYNTLDNDDVFQYFGAMNLVSSMYDDNGRYIEDRNQWETPQMFIADTSAVADYRDGDKVVFTAKEAIRKNFDAQFGNPKWIEGMMASGYSGSTMMAEFVDNLYGWETVTNGEAVSDAMWDRVFDLYVNDPEVRDWLAQTSPYALQSITSRMMEAERTGVMTTSDEQMSRLLEAYVESVAEYGVACCHHTCGNPTFDTFVNGLLSGPLAENIDRETLEQYQKILEQATDREQTPHPVDPDGPSGSSSGSRGSGNARIVEGTAPLPGGEEENVPDVIDPGREGPSDPEDDPGDGVGKDMTQVSGYEMVPKNNSIASAIADFIQNPLFSASSLVAILFVILVVGIIFYGSRKRGL